MNASRPRGSRRKGFNRSSVNFGVRPDTRDRDAAHTYLRAQGLDLEPPFIAPYGMKQLYLKDPDGYEICLQWRVAAT